MAGTQAAPAKMPPLAPGEFRFITNAITADGGQDNKPRRFQAIASSTVTDLAGNTITLSALQQLRDDFRNGLTVFMDHDYTNVVDKAFGRTDTAEIVETEARDERTNAPIYDLIVGGPVNEPNPKAVQLHDSMVGGYVKFGASIGAIVRKHTRDKETGGMLIEGITGKEVSIVGIPKNQRSWAYKASLAAADLPEDEDLSDDEPEEPAETQVIASNGETLQQWVVTPTVTTGNTTTYTPNVTITVPSVTITDDPSLKAQVDVATEVAVAETAPESDTPTDETTPGGQEAPSVDATPETAPTVDEAPDPAIEQQAADIIDTEDVVKLVQHVKDLVEEIGRQRAENERLKAELTEVKAGVERLASVEQDATMAIQKVMSLPLRRQAVGHVDELVNHYPQLDPRVSAYIARRTTKENA